MAFGDLAGLTNDLPVGAGLDTFLAQDGRFITFAQSARTNVDYETIGIRTLGFHGDRGFKSQGYSANLEVMSYLIREGNVEGALELPGYTPEGRFNLNSTGTYDFVLSDVASLKVLETAVACKLATSNSDYPNNGMNTRNTNWKSRAILPGIETS